MLSHLARNSNCEIITLYNNYTKTTHIRINQPKNKQTMKSWHSTNLITSQYNGCLPRQKHLVCGSLDFTVEISIKISCRFLILISYANSERSENQSHPRTCARAYPARAHIINFFFVQTFFTTCLHLACLTLSDHTDQMARWYITKNPLYVFIS